MIDKNIALPFNAQLLVPHRKPVCMVDRLLEYEVTNKSGVIESIISKENLLVGEDGVLDRIAYIELIAQSYATIKGYDDLLHDIPIKKGFLVIVKRIDIMNEAKLGDVLHIRMTTINEVGGFAVADGVVTRGDEVLATGNLTLYLPEEKKQ